MVTLRHWEEVGLLEPPRRVGGKRRYPESVLGRLALIDVARRAGFRLDEIGELLAPRPRAQPPGERWRTFAARKHTELDEQLAAIRAAQDLLAHLARCRCTTLDGCVSAVSCPDSVTVAGRSPGRVRRAPPA